MLRSIRQLLRRVWDRSWSRPHPALASLGGASPWFVRTDLIRPGATVISGGAGKDISFELELARRFDCRIHLFDPSPTGARTLGDPANRHERLIFHPLGLSRDAGTVEFAAPVDPTEGSFRLAEGLIGGGSEQFACVSVSRFVRERGLQDLTLLKLDIEGFEYGVIDDVLEAGLRFDQICVEYHHFMPHVTWSQTRRSLRALQAAGYRLQHKTMCDYLFVRTK